MNQHEPNCPYGDDVMEECTCPKKCKNCDLSQEMIDDFVLEYNHSQLYILINALENLIIPMEEQEYEFIRNDLLGRFRKQIKSE